MKRDWILAPFFVLVAAIVAGCSKAESAGDECADADCPCDCPDASCPDAPCPDAGCGEDTEDEWQCPDPIAASCPEGVGEEIPLLFEASDFGTGTRFVDVAPWTVLAERDEGEVRTISVITCWSADGWGISPCDASTAAVATIDVAADSALHAIAIAFVGNGTGVSGSPSHLAVLCDDEACALYGADLTAETPDTSLAAVAGGELPETAAVNGLWMSQESTIACAYGDGIHCFDWNAWTSPQASSEEYPHLNDMETIAFDDDSSPGAIAVGDLGRIAYSGFPDWSGYWGTAYPDWLAVAAFDGGYAIAGEDGAFAVMDDSWHGGCVLADEDIVALIHDLAGGEFGYSLTSLGITASGRVFVDAASAEESSAFMASPCFTGQILGASPKAAITLCGDATNAFLMDETALYGTTDCWVS
jgi:hypothetical protein